MGLLITIFCVPQVKAYYKCTPSTSVSVSTAPLNLTASISGTSFTANASQVVTIPVSVANTSSFPVSYTFTLSNSNLRFSGNVTTFTGTIAANTTSTVNLQIVEVTSNGTDTTGITMTLNTPYSKTINLGTSFSLTYDNVAPSCTWGTGPTIDIGGTGTVDLTCTDTGSGLATASLAASNFTLSNSNITITNVAASNVTNGKKFTLTLSSVTNGSTSITLKSGAVKDNANNSSNTPSVTVYERKWLTMSFATNCGSGSTSSVRCSITTGTSCNVTLPANGFTMPTNWTFNGWGTSSSATSGAAAGASVSISGNVTRYATCKKDVTITFDKNGCTTANGTASITLYNGATDADVNIPAHTMNTGWTDQTGSGTMYFSIPSANTTASANFYCSKNVTVTFNANGCTTADVSAPALEVFNGATSVTVNTPSHTMKTSWTDTTPSSVTLTVPSANTTASTNFTCSKSVTITANANGCTTAAKTTTKTLTNGATSVSVAKADFGYTMNTNWTDTTSYPKSITVASSSTTGSFNVTCNKTVTVTFNANGCTTAANTATVTLANGATSGTVTVPSHTMNTSWTDTTGTSKVVSGIASSATTATTNFTCSKTAAITVNKNGCITQDLTFNVTLTNGATSITTALPSYTMNTNWYDDVAGTVNLTVGSTATTGSMNFQCHKDVAVTFNANGCTTASGTANGTLYNGGTSLTVNTPSHTMKTGWNDTTPSTKTVTVASASTTASTNYTCNKTVTVTFNTNGCATSAQTATMTLANGATTGSVTVPSATANTNWTNLKGSTSSSATSGTAQGSAMTISGIESSATTGTAYYVCSKSVTVTFNANSCVSASQTATTTIYNGATSASVTVPSASGTNQSVRGASTNANSTSSSSWVSMGGSLSVSIASASTTGTAYYNCYKEVTVDFTGNGCSSSTSKSMYLYNGATSGTVQVPSVAMTSGWESLGASASASATTMGTAMGSNMSISGVASATWTVTRYYNCRKGATRTLSYSCNGGSGSTSSSTCTGYAYNGGTTYTSCSVDLRTNSCTAPSGFTWIAWGTGSSSTSGSAAGTSVTLTADTTRYAVWRKSTTYTLSYNCNGGSGAPSSGSCTAYAYNGGSFGSCSVNLASGCSFSGWTFNNWSTSSSATSGTAPGNTVSISGNTTYYALWKKSVTVTFNANGCTTAAATATGNLYNGATSGCFTVPSATLKSGWSDLDASTSSGATTGTAPGNSLCNISVASSGNTGTAYYVCNKTVTVTFNANGCTSAAGSATLNLHNGATSGSVAVPSHTTNSGWTDTTGTSVTLSVPSANTTASTNFTCKKEATRTLTYYANGGSGSMTSSTCTDTAVNGGAFPGCSVSLKSNGFTYSGWTFNGWGTASSSTSGSSAGTSVTLTANASRYATWKKDVTRTLSYNCNGGGGATGSSSCTATVYNGGDTGSCSVSLASNGCTKSNWTFNGWGTASSSTSGSSAGTSVTIGANTTRYATWKKTATITFNANGCTTAAATATATLYNGATSVSVTVPSHTMNTNWTDTTGSTKTVTVGADATTATTYFTCSKAVTVTFNANGCTTAAATATLTLTNGATSGVVTVPSHTMNTSWTDTTGSTKTISGIASASTTASTNFTCSKTANIQFNAGGCTTADAATTATLTNGATSVSVTVPSHTMKTSWTDTTGSTKSVTVAATSTTGTTSFTCSKSVTVTANANGCTTGAKSTTKTIINGATTVSVAKADFGYTMNSGWTDTTSYPKSVSIASANTTGSFNVTCSKVLYATFNKGANISSIGASSANCTIYNGSTAGCSVTFPSITASSGFTSVGWGPNNGASSGTAPGSVTITSDVTRYANAYDVTAPTCGTVTNGSTSWRTTSQTISVACSETGGTGCSATSFSGTFTNATTGTITISDVAGNTRNCTVNAYVDTTTPTCGTATGGSTSWITSGSRTITQPCTAGVSGCSSVTQTFSSDAKTSTITVTSGAGKTKACTVNVYRDASAPTCGTASGASTSWITSGTRTITQACSDSVSGCSSVEKSWSTDAKTGTITVTNGAGLTTNCTVNVYRDASKPVCGTVTGGSTSWITSGSRTISVACSDSVSGCTSTSYSNTWSTDAKTGSITITNGAGLTQSCSVNVYRDASAPSATCTITTNDSTSGITVNVTGSDSVSGIASGTGSTSGIKSTRSFTVTNGAGLTKSCSVTVTSSAVQWTKYRYPCSAASWNAATISYTSMSGCSSSGGGAMDASKTTCTTITSSTCTSNGQSIPCLKKSYQTRAGCATWSTSSDSNTPNLTSCSGSTGSYYKYTCTATAWSYHGS